MLFRSYLAARDYVYKTIELFDKKEFLPVMFSQEFYTEFKDREEFRRCVDMYLSVMIVMIDDALKNKESDDDLYNRHLSIIRQHQPGKLLDIFVRAYKNHRHRISESEKNEQKSPGGRSTWDIRL